MRRTVMSGDPREIARALLSDPRVWYAVAEAPIGDSRPLRSAANRVKARRYASFEAQAVGLSGRWETTVRRVPGEPIVRMHVRWVPSE